MGARPAVAETPQPTPTPKPEPRLEIAGVGVPNASKSVTPANAAVAVVVERRNRNRRVSATPPPPQKEAMDTLEVETDTSEWVVGKVAVVTVVIAEPGLLRSDPGSLDVDIGLDLVPVSAYYLVALEGGKQGQFDILPAPGQQEKQHRAPKGYPATWRYEVTPLKKGKMDLLFTLKVYAEGASAGTSISTRPLHLDVQTHFPKSTAFRINYWINHNGGWGPVFGVIAAGLTALAYTEWWRRKRRLRNPKTPPTSEPES